MSTSILLLAGVTLNSFFSALIMFVQYMADFAQRVQRLPLADGRPRRRRLRADSRRRCRWSSIRLRHVRVAACGAESAESRHSRFGRRRAASTSSRVQRLAFISGSLATSAAVSLAGPIGFIGIVVPHLVRLMVGVDHRIVLPASALFGASFLVVCDLVARIAAGAGRDSRRRRHGDDRRSLLPMAARQARLTSFRRGMLLRDPGRAGRRPAARSGCAIGRPGRRTSSAGGPRPPARRRVSCRWCRR